MNRTRSVPRESFVFRVGAVRFIALLALGGILVGVYLRYVRPRALQWGATAEELAARLPDDDLVPHPAFDATRAITIQGQPEEIWPWLVQMGYGRAGFYGYDLIENLGSNTGIESANRIVPALQHPHAGDKLPISSVASLVYGPMEPNQSLVWLGTENPPDGVFIWALVPVDAEHTRLVSRIRWRYVPTLKGVALGVFTELGDSVAVREILRGVRDRVEGRPLKPLWAEGVEITSWLLAMIELGVGVLFTLRWDRWGEAWFEAWLLAVGAGLLLLFVLYSDSPVWITAPLAWLYLGVMIWRRRENTSLRRVMRAIRSWRLTARSIPRF